MVDVRFTFKGKDYFFPYKQGVVDIYEDNAPDNFKFLFAQRGCYFDQADKEYRIYAFSSNEKVRHQLVNTLNEIQDIESKIQEYLNDNPVRLKYYRKTI